MFNVGRWGRTGVITVILGSRPGQGGCSVIRETNYVWLN